MLTSGANSSPGAGRARVVDQRTGIGGAAFRDVEAAIRTVDLNPLNHAVCEAYSGR